MAGVSTFSADALLVVVAGQKLPTADLPKPLAQALQAAVKDGDLALDNGRALYLGKAAGVKAPRVAA
ncbi:MAG TPA: leucyl aminopeptidase, partial [Burkholderiaceae bacterium]